MAERSPVTAREALTRARRHLPPGLAVAARLAGAGAVEVRAEGARVELSDGRTVLDFGSYAVPLLGHRHPAVVAAVHRQLDEMTVSTRLFANPVTAAAAAGLVTYLGGRLTRVHFGLNGGDAVEAAIKLARVASGRRRVLALRGGFHGKSLGALALTHHERYHRGLEPMLTDVTHVDAAAPDAAVREMAAGDVAALVFEPVQGENGVWPVDPAVVADWCVAAARHGVFVVADEIQTGLRRCGPRSVALDAGLPVDAVLLGKPLGGGVVPLSALVCSERMYEPLVADPVLHTATFAGNPLSTAAVAPALAAFEELSGRGARLAATVGGGLADLRRRYPALVTDVRGRGLLWGLDLPDAATTGRAVLDLARAGLLVSPCLSRPRTLRLLPPMVCADADVTHALALLDGVFGDLGSSPDAGRPATASRER